MARSTDHLRLDAREHISGLGVNLDDLQPAQRTLISDFKSRLQGHPAIQANLDYITNETQDGILTKFLIARHWNVDKAVKMIVEGMEWRQKRPAHRWVISKDQENSARGQQFKRACETGKIQCPGVDRHGRAVLIFDNSRENLTDPSEMMDFLAWNVELCYRTMQKNSDKIMLFMHMSNFSILTQPPMSVTKETILILATAFPESLGTCVLHEPPALFRRLWSVVSPFIDPRTVAKIFILTGDVSDGSKNDTLMRDVIGDDWKIITGVDQPSVESHYSQKFKKVIQSARGFRHEIYWKSVIERETAYANKLAGRANFTGLCVGERSMREFDMKLFEKIRTHHGVPSTFLQDFDFSKLAAGGGKGGNLMGFTPDRKYIVKETNKGDHLSLRKLMKEYVDHIINSDEPSLLCRFFAHFEDPTTKKIYVAMGNALSHKGEYAGLYDLKGTADDKTMVINGKSVKDVHKRVWHAHMWAGKAFWSEERHVYHSGKLHAKDTKFPVSPNQSAFIRQVIKRDCDFLARHQLMDYSLIIGIRVLMLHEAVKEGLVRDPNDKSPEVEIGVPFASVVGDIGSGIGDLGEVHVYYIGIIDFLQEWTLAKVAAKNIKFMESNKSTIDPGPYADRFHTYFVNKFTPTAAPLDPATAKLLATNVVRQHLSGNMDEQRREWERKRDQLTFDRSTHMYERVEEITTHIEVYRQWERSGVNASNQSLEVPTLPPSKRHYPYIHIAFDIMVLTISMALYELVMSMRWMWQRFHVVEGEVGHWIEFSLLFSLMYAFSYLPFVYLRFGKRSRGYSTPHIPPIVRYVKGARTILHVIVAAAALETYLHAPSPLREVKVMHAVGVVRLWSHRVVGAIHFGMSLAYLRAIFILLRRK